MSLRLRLALWYGGLTGVVVVIVSLFAYATHARAHYDDLDRTLVAAAQHLTAMHAGTFRPDDLVDFVAVPVAPNAVLSVHDATGDVVVASPGAALAPPLDPRAILGHPSRPPFGRLVGLAPALMGAHRAPGTFALATDVRGARWRFYVVPIAAGDQYLVASAPLEMIDASVAAFLRLVLLLIGLGVVASFGGGALVAGRALRPVATLTETANSIARLGSFNERVPASNRQDELGRLAATFNAMLASLERAYRAEQRFVADASHELRAPLTAIQANLELLERQPNMPPGERQEAITEASREARRLAQLVSDLLALARADAGVLLRQERVELDRVALETVAQARHLSGGQRVAIEQLEPVVVDGDPDRLRQLLLILLDNALKYTPADGTVTVGLRRQEAYAELEIRDTGVGIPAQDLENVFERFYRADPARSRDPGGTGLGLPIAKWIVQQHGGEIALASEVGRGTTVKVRLPVRAA